jgi:hypothetical protein
MADRLLVPFKSSYLRIFETLVVLAATFGLAAASQWLFPALSPSYVIVAGLIVGFTIVPRLGDRWAIRQGAPMMTRQERTRRYLSELGPIGSADHSASLLAMTQDARLRRGGVKTRQRRG